MRPHYKQSSGLFIIQFIVAHILDYRVMDTFGWVGQDSHSYYTIKCGGCDELPQCGLVQHNTLVNLDLKV